MPTTEIRVKPAAKALAGFSLLTIAEILFLGIPSPFGPTPSLLGSLLNGLPGLHLAISAGILLPALLGMFFSIVWLTGSLIALVLGRRNLSRLTPPPQTP